MNIARALALRPRLIILDEAVSALDKSVEAQVLNMLVDLKSELDLTYVFISHDLNVVQYLSDRVLVMYLGKIVEIGPVEAIYGDPQHPYTRALLSARPSMDPRKRTKEAPIQGDPPNPIDPPSGCRFRTRCPFAEDVCARTEPLLTDTGTPGRGLPHARGGLRPFKGEGLHEQPACRSATSTSPSSRPTARCTPSTASASTSHAARRWASWANPARARASPCARSCGCIPSIARAGRAASSCRTTRSSRWDPRPCPTCAASGSR